MGYPPERMRTDDTPLYRKLEEEATVPGRNKMAFPVCNREGFA
jgi:hypothetical protein